MVEGLSPAVFTAEGVAGTAALTIVSGDGQEATAGSEVSDSLVVSVADANGNPVSGVSVTWGGTVAEAQ